MKKLKLQKEKNEKVQHYLVKQTDYFVDPHGTPDEADSHYYITTEIEDLPPIGKYEQYEEIKDEFELKGSEDGYNATATNYTWIEVTSKEAKKYKKILKKFRKLGDLFNAS